MKLNMDDPEIQEKFRRWRILHQDLTLNLVHQTGYTKKKIIEYCELTKFFADLGSIISIKEK